MDIMQCVTEFFDILEVFVNAREANVSNLIKISQVRQR